MRQDAARRATPSQQRSMFSAPLSLSHHPLAALSVVELELRVAKHLSDREALEAIRNELQARRTGRAYRLRAEVASLLAIRATSSGELGPGEKEPLIDAAREVDGPTSTLAAEALA